MCTYFSIIWKTLLTWDTNYGNIIYCIDSGMVYVVNLFFDTNLIQHFSTYSELNIGKMVKLIRWENVKKQQYSTKTNNMCFWLFKVYARGDS